MKHKPPHQQVGKETRLHLKGVLEMIVGDFPESRLDDLLPWNWKAGSLTVNG